MTALIKCFIIICMTILLGTDLQWTPLNSTIVDEPFQEPDRSVVEVIKSSSCQLIELFITVNVHMLAMCVTQKSVY